LFKKVHVFRVKPGQELVGEIAGYCRSQGMSSGVVIGIIGSAVSVSLNFLKELPGKYEMEEFRGPLEIVGAQGSVALKGSDIVVHVHMQVCSQNGCQGGHLAEARIFSTAEVVIGELDYQLKRYLDDYTGLNELQD